MAPDKVIQSQHSQADASSIVLLGGWLFRHRTVIPLPFLLALLFVHAGESASSIALAISGAALVGCGEALRLWGVHHIGVISRTRSDRLGPLIDSGPFRYVRNPLYIGNIALWAGFAINARLVWLAPAIALILALEYHAIVRWEEQLLEARLGNAYRDYQRRVPRWVPRVRLKADTTENLNAGTTENLKADTTEDGVRESGSVRLQPDLAWRATLFSERGTLIAIAAGYLLLWVKARF